MLCIELVCDAVCERAGVFMHVCVFSADEAELNLFHTCPSLPGGGA